MIAWINKALPGIEKLRYRSPTDLYSLIGALHDVSKEGRNLKKLNAEQKGRLLIDFANKMKRKNPTGDAARYLAAASRQTDNIQPRTTRIDLIAKLLKKA